VRSVCVPNCEVSVDATVAANSSPSPACAQRGTTTSVSQIRSHPTHPSRPPLRTKSAEPNVRNAGMNGSQKTAPTYDAPGTYSAASTAMLNTRPHTDSSTLRTTAQ
jgi:hypothetical protein